MGRLWPKYCSTHLDLLTEKQIVVPYALIPPLWSHFLFVMSLIYCPAALRCYLDIEQNFYVALSSEAKLDVQCRDLKFCLDKHILSYLCWGSVWTNTGTRGNVGLDTLMGMLSGLGAGGGLGVPNASNGLYTLPSWEFACSYCVPSADIRFPVISVPPEELYATQLGQLQEMGFFDTAENIRALMATSGNVHAAVERLLGNFG